MGARTLQERSPHWSFPQFGSSSLSAQCPGMVGREPTAQCREVRMVQGVGSNLQPNALRWETPGTEAKSFPSSGPVLPYFLFLNGKIYIIFTILSICKCSIH